MAANGSAMALQSTWDRPLAHRAPEEPEQQRAGAQMEQDVQEAKADRLVGAIGIAPLIDAEERIERVVRREREADDGATGDRRARGDRRLGGRALRDGRFVVHDERRAERGEVCEQGRGDERGHDPAFSYGRQAVLSRVRPLFARTAPSVRS